MDAARRAMARPAMQSMAHEAKARFAANRASRRHAKGALAAATLIGALASAALWSLALRPAALDGQEALEETAVAARDQTIVETAVGESVSVDLADGSTVDLNSGTRLAFDLTHAERRVRLLEGQAFFDVAHDPARAFVVRAGGKAIKALGTSFDVRIIDGDVSVTLIEGRVAIERDDRPDAPATILEPGQQALAQAANTVAVRGAAVEAVVSWRDGIMQFDDVSLAEAVAEANRYTTRRIELVGEDVAALRLSGAFPNDRIDAFVDALAQYFDLAVDASDPQAIRLSQRPA